MSQDLRIAPRAAVRIPTLVEKVAAQPVSPDLALAPHYERVLPDGTALGVRVPGIILDLSVGGVFIATRAFPLLSRLSFTFPLEGFGQVDALGWVFWRRLVDVTIDVDGDERILPAGVGVMFEAVSLPARQAIASVLASQPAP